MRSGHQNVGGLANVLSACAGIDIAVAIATAAIKRFFGLNIPNISLEHIFSSMLCWFICHCCLFGVCSRGVAARYMERSSASHHRP